MTNDSTIYEMKNADEFEDMLELTDSETDTPTVQQSPVQVESTELCAFHTGGNKLIISRWSRWCGSAKHRRNYLVGALVTGKPAGLGWQLSGTHRPPTTNFSNVSPAEQFKT